MDGEGEECGKSIRRDHLSLFHDERPPPPSLAPVHTLYSALQITAFQSSLQGLVIIINSCLNLKLDSLGIFDQPNSAKSKE